MDDTCSEMQGNMSRAPRASEGKITVCVLHLSYLDDLRVFVSLVCTPPALRRSPSRPCVVPPLRRCFWPSWLPLCARWRWRPMDPSRCRRTSRGDPWDITCQCKRDSTPRSWLSSPFAHTASFTAQIPTYLVFLSSVVWTYRTAVIAENYLSKTAKTG